MRIQGRWKILLIILLPVVKTNCDTLEDLVLSLQTLNDKVDSLRLDQQIIIEKVDQLQNGQNALENKFKKLEENLDKIILRIKENKKIDNASGQFDEANREEGKGRYIKDK